MPLLLPESMSLAARWWHTVRHLHPVQWYGRLWFRLYRPVVDARSVPAVRTPESSASWQRPIPRPGNLQLPDTFAFLNLSLRLRDVGWDSPSISRLWRYHLHYFDWLTDDQIPPGEQRELIDRWIADNPRHSRAGSERAGSRTRCRCESSTGSNGISGCNDAARPG